MTLRSLLLDLTPPLLVRWLRPDPVQPQQSPAHATEHTVRSGPLRGVRLLVNDGQPAFREMIEGSYDDYLWTAMPEVLDGGILLDIGGHIGYHALGMAAKYPSSKVVVFEPNPANLTRLERNIALNTALAERIDVQAMALSDTTGSLVFHSSANIDDQTSSGGYLESGSPPLDAAVYARAGFTRSEVPAHRLDELATAKEWQRIQVMKIDVEGAEHLVLAGARQVLERDHPLLLIEIHSVVCMLQVLELLHPLGYKVRLLHEDRASRCFVVARWKG